MVWTSVSRTYLPVEFCAVVVFLGCVCCDSPKTVSLSLSAKWPETSLLQETAEFLAEEANDKFWQFVDRVAAADAHFGTSAVDQTQYNRILTLAAAVVTPLQLRYLKLALSLRTFSPKVAMHEQLSGSNIPDCETHALIQGERVCDAEKIKDLISNIEEEGRNPTLDPLVFAFDHFHPASDPKGIVVIVSGFIGSDSFKSFHEVLSKLCKQTHIHYILRHSSIKDKSAPKVRLSGYGVELAIKSTEYKAQDDTKVKAQWEDAKGAGLEDELHGFRFTSLASQNPALIDKLAEFREHLVDSTNDMAPLRVWEIQDLSLQTAQRIIENPPEGALKLLRELSQNFPRLARSLSKIPIKKEVKKEIRKNQAIWEQTLGLDAGESALFLSGIKIDLTEFDIFSLLDTLKSETTVLEGLHSFGFRGTSITKLAALELKSSQDQYALDVRDSAVVFLNNLEEDDRYESWPGSVQDLLRPSFPGMLRHVRKNFHNIIFFLNPVARDAATKGLIKHAESFFTHNTPLRLGFVLVSSAEEEVDGKDDASVAAFRLFNYYRQSQDSARAMSFLSDLANINSAEVITPERIMGFYNGRVSDEVFGVNSKFDKGRRAATAFYKKSGLASLPQVLNNGVPLGQSDLDHDAFEDALIYAVLKVTNSFQVQVYNGEITDETDLLDYLMDKDHVMPRLNAQILNTDNPKSIFTTMVPTGSSSSPLDTVISWSSVIPSIRHIYKTDPSEMALPPLLTHLLVADFDTSVGLSLLTTAMKHLKKAGTRTRLGVMHYAADGSGPELLSKAIQVALEDLSHNTAKIFITKLLKDQALKDFLKSLDENPSEGLSVHGVDLVDFKKKILNLLPSVEKTIKHQQLFTRSEVGIGVGGSKVAVISNGRILRLSSVEQAADITVDDFLLIERILLSGMEKIQTELNRLASTSGADIPDVSSDLYMQLGSLMFPNVQSGKRHQVQVQSSTLSGIDIPVEMSGDESLPTLEVVAILDPVSRAAQKVAPLLDALKKVIPMHIKIYMNCKEKHSELPLKSFYKYTIEPEPSFNPTSGALLPLSTVFSDVPKDVLFTMAMDLPEQWLVGPVHSPHDLDNIKLASVEGGIHAEYELENILLEGHCFDSGSGQPPRGLQFTLKGMFDENDSKNLMDTIVMANLGYFQLKANPGAWVLKLRDGPSNDVYAISSHEGTEKLEGRAPDDVTVIIDSFKTKVIKIKVSKRPGKENVDILGGGDSDDQPGYSIWDTLSDTLGTGKTTKAVEEKTEAEKEEDNTINIFSLATGHLYERLMRIMMLSVLKHTKSPVKFWILKNFLSPDFKKFLPVMAKTYGFKFELVEYKWPRWLHQQTDKQRVIWGYKILFLDVLFPLSVKKIIFVDADQIVRADMKELKDFDLEGAPYGYTPFCSDKKEMDGFRFWKSGYWASHLGHRKYHISALYVIDLQKFRKIAAGDRLRGQYQGLSQDPNSLANLDQDLPNNMIHQVAIKSLPQEWLWCETWCSDDSKKNAKTIDLCNNPLTKEPKLTAAVRIAPEWADYDNEIKSLKQKTEDRTGQVESEIADKSTIKPTDKVPPSHIEL